MKKKFIGGQDLHSFLDYTLRFLLSLTVHVISQSFYCQQRKKFKENIKTRKDFTRKYNSFKISPHEKLPTMCEKTPRSISTQMEKFVLKPIFCGKSTTCISEYLLNRNVFQNNFFLFCEWRSHEHILAQLAKNKFLSINYSFQVIKWSRLVLLKARWTDHCFNHTKVHVSFTGLFLDSIRA